MVAEGSNFPYDSFGVSVEFVDYFYSHTDLWSGLGFSSSIQQPGYGYGDENHLEQCLEFCQTQCDGWKVYNNGR